MGRRHVVALLAVLTVAPARAYAQRITLIDCGPSMTMSLGLGASGDRNAEQTGPGLDAAAGAEFPVSGPWSVRGDAGAVAWTFQQSDYVTDALVREERVRIGRVTLTAINRPPRDCGAPFRPYAGFGAGVYRYRFPDQRGSVAVGGLHALFGMDVMTGERIGFNWEVGIQAINGPSRQPVLSAVLFSLRGTIGARIRF